MTEKEIFDQKTEMLKKINQFLKQKEQNSNKSLEEFLKELQENTDDNQEIFDLYLKEQHKSR